MDLSRVTIGSSSGETVAEFVPAANMVCRSLRSGGAELLDQTHGLEGYAQRGKTMGIPLLHPWANRLSGDGYAAAGRRVVLPASENRYPLDPNGLPIHGAMPGDLRWEVLEHVGDRALARLRWDQPRLLELFPFAHELSMEAQVDDGRLSIATTLRATGADPVPVSFGFHPYLRPPAGPRAGWELSLGASQRLALDDRMIPTGAREPLGPTRFRLGESSLDDGLAGLDAPPVFAAAGNGTTLALTFEEGFEWAQLYAPSDKDFICFEPMTAPTDALNSGDGLHVVAPGEQYRTRFSVTLTTTDSPVATKEIGWI